MAETRQGGFHAFEKRVHEIEDADREAERKGQSSTPASAPRQTMPEQQGAKRETPKK